LLTSAAIRPTPLLQNSTDGKTAPLPPGTSAGGDQGAAAAVAGTASTTTATKIELQRATPIKRVRDAWKLRSGPCALSREIGVEETQQASGAVLAKVAAVEAVEERALLGERQRRSVAIGRELDGSHRHRRALVVQVHLVRVDDALVRDDVLVDGLVAVAHVLVRSLAQLAAAVAVVEFEAVVDDV